MKKMEWKGHPRDEELRDDLPPDERHCSPLKPQALKAERYA
jgi:hypothetical protein